MTFSLVSLCGVFPVFHFCPWFIANALGKTIHQVKSLENFSRPRGCSWTPRVNTFFLPVISHLALEKGNDGDILHFTFHILHFTFHIPHFTFHILHFTSYISHSTFPISRFTFDKGNDGDSALGDRYEESFERTSRGAEPSLAEWTQIFGHWIQKTTQIQIGRGDGSHRKSGGDI